jgi:hypothetical protein|tara:strand:+ start:33 stop:272 length:240 start_codon:yes stop_codon:yes gene_type:complete
MMEELETDIDRSSPIWGGSDCDYRSLETEVASYWSQFYKNELNLEQSGNGLLYELKPKEFRIVFFFLNLNLMKTIYLYL